MHSAVIGTGAYKEEKKQRKEYENRKKNKKHRNKGKKENQSKKQAKEPPVPMFTNSKLQNQKIKQSIEADLGFNIESQEPATPPETPNSPQDKKSFEQLSEVEDKKEASGEVDAEEIMPLNSNAKKFVPKNSQVKHEQAAFPIKALDKAFLSDFRTLFKQSCARGLMTELAKDSWPISSEIFIKETKLPPDLLNYSRNIAPQQMYHGRAYYSPYVPYYAPGYYGVPYGIRGVYPYQGYSMPSAPVRPMYPPSN
eukprot:TRINITY_DN13939_c0_g2_i1.p1 TRINITY_DN13939_c0_g2~~TRINITY_DN13939_c0_g2_i1.p1  ORF type:complete len:253 (-),score=39.56 TRINITY_DN13939_c0_g2_i1:127-885(-)